MELLQDPHFWVALSFVIFVAAAFRPASRFITGRLDARSTTIASELEQAKRLRAEAEQVLADYKRRQVEMVKESKSILEKTRKDAEQIAHNAKAELHTTIEKHTRLAKEKITQVETKAAQDVANHMADVAIAAARAIMRDYLEKGGTDEIIKGAAAEIERKLH